MYKSRILLTVGLEEKEINRIKGQKRMMKTLPGGGEMILAIGMQMRIPTMKTAIMRR